MDYEKKYNEALERARKAYNAIPPESYGARKIIEDAFPELRESEGERVWKAIDEIMKLAKAWKIAGKHGLTAGDIRKWVKKQKEQKQNATEDMPYIADEHFYEREPADSFKYRLAEYMTKNCKKGEGPYGYSYSINSESILQMAKEELIKRGELKEPKPVELSKEDKMILDNVSYILIGLNYKQVARDYKQAVENLLSLRRHWKPTEEQMDALAYAIQILDDGLSPKAAKAGEELEHLREQLKKPI